MFIRKSLKNLTFSRFIMGIIYICVLCFMCGCSNNSRLNEGNDIGGTGSTAEITLENAALDSGSDTADGAVEISDGNVYSWDSEVQFDGVSYKIESIQFTQQLGNHEKEAVNYLTDAVDENGNLMNANYFAWIKLKLKNDSGKKKEIMLNYRFSCIHGNNASEVIAEAVYISKAQSSRPDLQFQYYLEAGEEQEVELGYWVDGDTVDGTLCYLIGYSGSQLEYSDNCFLNVEEFWNAK